MPNVDVLEHSITRNDGQYVLLPREATSNLDKLIEMRRVMIESKNDGDNKAFYDQVVKLLRKQLNLPNELSDKEADLVSLLRLEELVKLLQGYSPKAAKEIG